MIVRRDLVNVVILWENHQLFAKIAKNAFSGHTGSFFDYLKKKRSLIFYEKSKTDLGFEIGQQQ